MKFKSEFLRVEAEYGGNGAGNLLYFFDETRTLKKNGQCILEIPKYLMDWPVFCYSPDTSTILAKEQKIRRGYIDRVCFYRDKSHIFDLRFYNRMISQKNAEFQKDKPDQEYLESVNAKLVETAVKISVRRSEAANIINKRVSELYSKFGGKDEKFSLDYVTNIEDTDMLMRETDKRKCLYGVHRDRFYSKNMSRIYDKFSSYGQKKTFELLVLLAILLDVEELLKTDIITLLDDFEAGLDDRRVAAFMELFSGSRQLIVTGVKNRLFTNYQTINLQVDNAE
jgi:DNA replication and repair protein RecF